MKEKNMKEPNKFNNEEESLSIYKLYVGKMYYQNFDGVTIEEEDYNVVGLVNCIKHEFYDVLNYKKIPIWSNKNPENNLGRYIVKTMLPLREYLKSNGTEYGNTIKRKELRELIEPENVKNPILKRIVSIFHKIDNSKMDNDSKEKLKIDLLNNMNWYIEKISNNDFTVTELQVINEKLDTIEYMTYPQDIKEIKIEEKRLKKRLFNKEKD